MNEIAERPEWLPYVKQYAETRKSAGLPSLEAVFGPGRWKVDGNRQRVTDNIMRNYVYWLSAGHHHRIGSFDAYYTPRQSAKRAIAEQRRQRAAERQVEFGASLQPGERRVTCPVPGCGRVVALTSSGNLEWHANGYGFCCDGTNMTPERAAVLQIDALGRLIGVDEMVKVQV